MSALPLEADTPPWPNDVGFGPLADIPKLQDDICFTLMSDLDVANTDDFIKRSKAPLLGHFAENDPYESPEGVRELEQAYRDAGREVTTHVYPGTGHWFAEPSRDAYRPDAAQLAFERTVAFLRSRLGG